MSEAGQYRHRNLIRVRVKVRVRIRVRITIRIRGRVRVRVRDRVRDRDRVGQYRHREPTCQEHTSLLVDRDPPYCPANSRYTAQCCGEIGCRV